MSKEIHTGLMNSPKPWVRYRTLRDLLEQPDQDRIVKITREEMIAHPKIQQLIAEANTWPGSAIERHNDASHVIYKISTLADFGLKATDPGMAEVVEAIMIHQSAEGAFQSLVNIPKSFGGSGDDAWSWMSCDSPTLLYILLAMDMSHDTRVQRAALHLISLATDIGWMCVNAPELGKFRGPGRKADPCPIANVYALKALAQIPELIDCPTSHLGAEMLLSHWERQREAKMYLFGIGSDFRKLKYPFIWYDILHVADVLSHFPFIYADPRFKEMLSAVVEHVDSDGRYRPGSMYKAWKDWEFADKKNPSDWITFLVERILKRVNG